MSIKTDEDEHSIEMQLSYLAKVMESRKGKFKIVPIMIGNISSEKEKMYGELLAPYLLQDKTIFVISSDFCHWGERFSYTYYDDKCGEIWNSIESLDRKGMDLIEVYIFFFILITIIFYCLFYYRN
jgi:MEMO1 family protein